MNTLPLSDKICSGPPYSCIANVSASHTGRAVARATTLAEITNRELSSIPGTPATVNLRLAAVSGLFSFRSMRDPDVANPVPKGREAKRLSAGERGGLLAHVSRAPRRRLPLRVRDARRLPKSLDRREVVAAGSRPTASGVGLTTFKM